MPGCGRPRSRGASSPGAGEEDRMHPGDHPAAGSVRIVADRGSVTVGDPGRPRSAGRAEPAWERYPAGRTPPSGPASRTAGPVKEVAMPTVPLPDDPDLDQLRKRARELQQAVREGEPQALAIAAEHHPSGVPGADRAAWKLSASQLVLARRHGFPSWPALHPVLDVLVPQARAPVVVAASPVAATEFLRRAF